MEEKRFTQAEANALLPKLLEELRLLQSMASDIEAEYEELQRMKANLRQSSPGMASGDPFFEKETRIDFMRMEADMLVGNFVRQGVQLKSIRPGLIDFPAMLDGEEVLLCWKEGEESVLHYHSWDDGFRGRKRLP